MTQLEIDNALAKWKEGLLTIAKLNSEKKDYEDYATKFISIFMLMIIIKFYSNQH